ncbi:MAG: response regulator transcription factor [Clostridia bacterium]|nr:response regulator transcription factor [Clostridia bacterium]MBQ5757409.1 response regulator transcription factor [Clostridia bacterium]
MLVVVVVDRDGEAISDTVGKMERVLGEIPHTFARIQDYKELVRKVEKRVFMPDIAVMTLDASAEGIEAAGELNRLAPDCGILFLADDPAHMTDVYAVAHDCFMLKEQMEEYFPDALCRTVEKIRVRHEKAERNHIFVKIHTKMVRFGTDEIVSLERMGRSTVIHMLNGRFVTVEHPLSIVSRVRNPHFLRCHQSYWVNTMHISEGSAKELVTEDGNRIPVSRSYRAELKKLGNGFFIQE